MTSKLQCVKLPGFAVSIVVTSGLSLAESAFVMTDLWKNVPPVDDPKQTTERRAT